MIEIGANKLEEIQEKLQLIEATLANLRQLLAPEIVVDNVAPLRRAAPTDAAELEHTLSSLYVRFRNSFAKLRSSIGLPVNGGVSRGTVH